MRVNALSAESSPKLTWDAMGLRADSARRLSVRAEDALSQRQSMKWIELKRSSPVQIHEPLILIQSNPADNPEAESSPAQSGHNIVAIYQIPCKNKRRCV